MKEPTINTNQNTQHLETIFFSALEALRGVWRTHNATSVLFSLVFFKRMLALCKEGKLAVYTDTELLGWSNAFHKLQVTHPKQATKQLIVILEGFSAKSSLFYQIFNPFITALQNEKSSQHLIQVVLMLEELDFSTRSFSVASFGDFFNESLHRVALQTGKSGQKYITPRPINQLLVALADVEDGAEIYDPTVGQGTTLLAFAQASPNLFFFGQEQNLHTWALCKMNLIANGIYDAQIHYNDSLTKDSFSKKQMDIAIAHFPFGAYLPTYKVKNQSYLQMPFDTGTPKVHCTNLFIQLMLSKLKEEGKLLTILPIQALTAEREDRKMRKFLLRRDLIEGIITLPFGMLQTTRVPVCILIVNKNKDIDRKGNVVFVNGANLKVNTKTSYRRLTENHIHYLSLAYHYLENEGLEELKDCVAKVPLHEIILNDYNLDAKSYASPFIYKLRALDDLGQLIQVKDVLKPDTPSLWFNTAPTQDLRYIRVQDLGQSISNYEIQIDKAIAASEVKQIAGQLVGESVVMVNRAGKQLLVGYFEFGGEPILVNENIMTFRVDAEKINIEYLVIQLFDDLFLQQLDMYKLDYQHKSISEAQFEELKINLPDMAAQNKIVKQKKIELLQAEERKVEQLRNDLNLGREKARNEQYKIISSLQHELGNRLPAILTEFKNLKDYLKDKEEEQSPIRFEEPIFPFFEDEDITNVDQLNTVIERIESILVHSINTLDATGNIIKADRNKLNLELIDIKALLEEIQQLYSQETQFDIQIEIDEDENDNELLVQAMLDRTQITTALTNLIENAKRHGFSSSSKKYTILFQAGISANQQEVVLLYKNDGQAFPFNFSFEDFISYGNYAGHTGHSGIGGFLINQIIENHNGSLTFRADIPAHNPFKVQFEIRLPIKAKDK